MALKRANTHKHTQTTAYLDDCKREKDSRYEIHVWLQRFGNRFDAATRVYVLVHFDHRTDVLHVEATFNVDESRLENKNCCS